MAFPFGIPAQSEHIELSPPHIPHWSSIAEPPHSSLQSIVESPSQMPAQSIEPSHELLLKKIVKIFFRF